MAIKSQLRYVEHKINIIHRHHLTAIFQVQLGSLFASRFPCILVGYTTSCSHRPSESSGLIIKMDRTLLSDGSGWNYTLEKVDSF